MILGIVWRTKIALVIDGLPVAELFPVNHIQHSNLSLNWIAHESKKIIAIE